MGCRPPGFEGAIFRGAALFTAGPPLPRPRPRPAGPLRGGIDDDEDDGGAAPFIPDDGCVLRGVPPDDPGRGPLGTPPRGDIVLCRGCCP